VALVGWVEFFRDTGEALKRNSWWGKLLGHGGILGCFKRTDRSLATRAFRSSRP
jgi:hypothetical protein